MPDPAATPPRRNDIPPFAALRAFDAVGRLGGIRRAAEELSLDHAVVSRHIRALEQWTGTMLVTRQRQGAALTEEGARYHHTVAAAMDMLATATIDLRHAVDDAQLGIWAMPGLASKWLLPRIAAFTAAHPGIAVDVRPSDRAPDFNRHEADVDLRYAPDYGARLSLPENLRAVEVARPVVMPVAAPAYLDAHPPIASPADLLTHDLLHEEDFENWRAWFAAQGVDPATKLSGMRLWHAHLTVDAAAQGRGIALANRFLAMDEVAAGRVREVGHGSGAFGRVDLGAYLFVARADCWSRKPIARFRHWLTVAAAR